MTITLKHSITGVIKKAPTGFSWTSLFFGLFVPLFRGDILWCILYVLLLPFVGIIIIVFPFIYNKIYIKRLLERGFAPADEASKKYLQSKNLIR